MADCVWYVARVRYIETAELVEKRPDSKDEPVRVAIAPYQASHTTHGGEVNLLGFGPRHAAVRLCWFAANNGFQRHIPATIGAANAID